MLRRKGSSLRPPTEQCRQADPIAFGTSSNGHGADKAIDPRLAAEVKMLNELYARAEKQAAAAERKALERNSIPITVEELPC